MGIEWPTSRLEDLTELIVDCPHSTPKWTDDGEIVLRSQNIRNGRLDFSSTSYTDNEGYLSRIKRALPQAEDLIFTREAPMGEVCMIPNGLKCCMGQRMVLIRTKRKVLSPHYLLYLIQSPFLQHQIGWNEGTGTTVSNIRIPNIKGFEIPLPPLPEQKAIAHILGTLDDKIELNRRMNATLEGMAQALFKSWFVDFDPVIDNALAAGNPIPDELAPRAEVRRQALANGTANREAAKPFPAAFQKTESMGWIPEGWEFNSFDKSPLQILDGDRGKNYPKRTEFTKSGHCLFLNAGNVTKNGYNFDSNDFIPRERDELLGKGKLQREDIVLTTRGTVGNFAYYDKSIPFDHLRINSGMVILRSTSESKYPLFLLQYLKSFLFESQTRNLTSGSAQPQLPIRDIKKILIIQPNDERTLSSYTNHIESFIDEAARLSETNRTLTNLRDTLLPKLIPGELRIPEASVI